MGRVPSVINIIPYTCNMFKLPEVPKARGTAGSAKAVLQQLGESLMDGNNPRDLSHYIQLRGGGPSSTSSKLAVYIGYGVHWR